MIKSMCLLAGVTAVWFLAGGAQAQLSGEARSRFLAGFRPACLRNLRDDERLAGVLNSAGPRIAATLDLSVASSMATRSAEERQAWFAEIGADAIEYCIQRRGGFMPGMSVTPNH